ncbi:MAG: hypothetical protein P1V97_08350 [Planctomycetota bacterium]|nr:hypothetical protein [Planctomycetota bacterium]
MKLLHPFILFSALLTLTQSAQAQNSLANGKSILAKFTNETTRKSFNGQNEKLTLYIGRTLVGSIEFESMVVGKALVLKDTLELRIDGLGQVDLVSTQTINEKGELVEASLKSRATQASGNRLRRSYSLRRKGTGFLWRRVEGKDVKEKQIDAPLDTLALAPPVGFVTRLPKVITKAGRYKFIGIDIETGSKTQVKVNVDPFEKHGFRGDSLSCRMVTIKQAAAALECFYDPKQKLLKINFSQPRIKAAGGRTDSERFQTLPEAFKGIPSTPIPTVILFFRALADSQIKDIEAMIDFDAMFDIAAKERKNTVKGEKAAFKKALMKILTNETWLRERRISVNSGSMELSDLKATTKDGVSEVSLPGGGKVLLKKNGKRWLVIGFKAPTKKTK